MIAQFIARYQEIRSKIERGVISNADRNFLRQTKLELRKHVRSIEQLETLLGESFD